MIPGAVNAHAHLGFRRKDAPEGGTFSGWLGRLIERLPEKEAWTAEAARDSAREAVEAGTTYMAESSPYGECLPQLAESGMAGTVFAEFFPHEIGTPEEAVEFIVGKAQRTAEKVCPSAWMRGSACILRTPWIPNRRVWRRGGRGRWAGRWRYTSPRALKRSSS